MATHYLEAAFAIEPSLSSSSSSASPRRHSSSLKSRTFRASLKNVPVVRALASETLRHRKTLEAIWRETGVDPAGEIENYALLMVLTYELLMGAGRIRGGGRMKRFVTDHAEALREARDRIAPESTPLAQRVVVGPTVKYGRLNLLKEDDVEKVARELNADADEHIPTLLAIPASPTLYKHPLVESGVVILQDKSSCFPAFALFTEMRRRDLLAYDCLDACAAPGNKTSQLAGYLTEKARVYAFDRSKERCALLRERMTVAGAIAANRVVITCGDFLACDANSKIFSRVRTILLDPSCSGSGALNDLEREVEEEVGEEEKAARLERLASFQYKALMHATSFPQVELVSYSTCSVNEEENERVVAKVLRERREEWELIHALPKWARRGKGTALGAEEKEMVIRADPNLDKIGGFFVALFGRRRNSSAINVVVSSSPSNKPKKRRRHHHNDASKSSFTPLKRFHIAGVR